MFARLSISASAFIFVVPTVSTSHCQNSLYLPRPIGPSRHTFPSWYLLNGSFSVGFIPTYLEKGIVKSYLSPSSRPPWSVKLNVSLSISFPPAYLALSTSYRSIAGVSSGTNPYFSNVFFSLSIKSCSSIISSGVVSFIPFASCSFIFFFVLFCFFYLFRFFWVLLCLCVFVLRRLLRLL